MNTCTRTHFIALLHTHKLPEHEATMSRLTYAIIPDDASAIVNVAHSKPRGSLVHGVPLWCIRRRRDDMVKSATTYEGTYQALIPDLSALGDSYNEFIRKKDETLKEGHYVQAAGFVTEASPVPGAQKVMVKKSGDIVLKVEGTTHVDGIVFAAQVEMRDGELFMRKRPFFAAADYFWNWCVPCIRHRMDDRSTKENMAVYAVGRIVQIDDIGRCTVAIERFSEDRMEAVFAAHDSARTVLP